ncbi:Single-stranded TG1-3 DNA-binding protein [Tolypocladium capitatum]|uniref:Single-stranded TG1-3 DNA-binding protein n=1 Tax=Tolypocladium capitatum TaxID=45235 RepID=A0A2K3QM51_9HYPO|nr:Single-stranded TG1-3 DNA-binding protein [Tolypocladium capitatum]
MHERDQSVSGGRHVPCTLTDDDRRQAAVVPAGSPSDSADDAFLHEVHVPSDGVHRKALAQARQVRRRGRKARARQQGAADGVGEALRPEAAAVCCRHSAPAAADSQSPPPNARRRTPARPPPAAQQERREAENISDSRLQLALPFSLSLHISPVKLVSPRNASPSVYLRRYLGHEATLTNLLPHCPRVQLPSFSIERCCVRLSSTDSVNTSIHQPANMSATNVEKASEAAVNDVANTLSNISISQPADDKAAANEAASASAAEGRRLYIGNLAYATTEGELKDFFKSYLV